MHVLSEQDGDITDKIVLQPQFGNYRAVLKCICGTQFSADDKRVVISALGLLRMPCCRRAIWLDNQEFETSL